MTDENKKKIYYLTIKRDKILEHIKQLELSLDESRRYNLEELTPSMCIEIKIKEKMIKKLTLEENQILLELKKLEINKFDPNEDEFTKK